MQTMNQALFQAVQDKVDRRRRRRCAALHDPAELRRMLGQPTALDSTAPALRGGRRWRRYIVWKGRTLARRDPDRRDRRRAPGRGRSAILRKKRILVTSVTAEGRRSSRCRSSARRGPRQHEGPGDLHPPVRDHDLGRSAAGAVPRHPRRAVASKPSFGSVIADVTREVEAGSTLSDALGKHKNVFDDLFRNMVAAGEAGGVLDDDPDAPRASTSRRPTRSSARSRARMIYPAVVLTVALGATAFMLHLHHPDVRQDVHRLRRRAAAADQDRARAVRTSCRTSGG